MKCRYAYAIAYVHKVSRYLSTSYHNKYSYSIDWGKEIELSLSEAGYLS